MSTETITICGRVFTVPVPDRYNPGQTLELTEGESSSIRQTFCENVRNNLAGRIKKVEGMFPDDSGAMAQEFVEAWQDKVNEYAGQYSFGVRSVGGGRPAVDPETREALTLIKEEVRKALRAKYGPKHGRSAEAITEAANRVLESPRGERFRRIAKQRLRQQAEAATDILEGMDEAA